MMTTEPSGTSYINSEMKKYFSQIKIEILYACNCKILTSEYVIYLSLAGSLAKKNIMR